MRTQPRLSDSERDERRKRDRERLKQAAEQLLTSEGWQRWVRVRAQGGLARLSLNNQLLVALSCPEATFVAGFRAWLKLGYCVRKGEKAIRIIAPMPIEQRETETADADDDTRVLFKGVSVFDRSQVAPIDGMPEAPLEPPSEPALAIISVTSAAPYGGETARDSRARPRRYRRSGVGVPAPISRILAAWWRDRGARSLLHSRPVRLTSSISGSCRSRSLSGSFARWLGHGDRRLGCGVRSERLEDEHLDGDVGVDVVIAHEADDLAAGELLDLLAAAFAHHALPAPAQVEHGLTLAGCDEVALPTRERVLEHHEHRVIAQGRLRLRRPATRSTGQLANDRIGDRQRKPPLAHNTLLSHAPPRMRRPQRQPAARNPDPQTPGPAATTRVSAPNPPAKLRRRPPPQPATQAHRRNLRSPLPPARA